jgi:hypothetical protein
VREHEIKYMPIDSFMDEGYLQEANRLFFHPRGLALEVTTGVTREDVEKALKDAGIQFGHMAVDNVMTGLRVFGILDDHISGVWDYRGDPEGIGFGPGPLTTEGSHEKAKAVQEEYLKHLRCREEEHGWPGGHQPVAGWDG